jgi:predicted component of viral defense system (DUF524 family)
VPLLLRAEGHGWNLEVIGKLPELPAFIAVAPVSVLTSSSGMTVATLDRQTGLMASTSSGQNIEALFFEAVAYDIHLERDDPSIKLALPPGAELRRTKSKSEHYTLNFGNNVGFCEIGVVATGMSESFTIEVFSRKADYKTDYVAMRDEVSAMLRNLAMAANSKTYSLAAPAKDHQATLVEWFALIQKQFGDFIKLANAIAKNPHTGLSKKAFPVRTERARSVTRHVVAQALRGKNSGAAVSALGIALPRRIKESISTPTFDTPENRYYKALIMATYRNMRALSKVEESGDEDAEFDAEKKFFISIRPELKAMQRQLESVLRTPFLVQVGPSTLERPTSMVFHKHPLYSRFDKLCRMLNGGLSFAKGLVPIGVKSTSLLYEYWCFLTLVALLRDRFELVEQSVVKFNKMKTTVALTKGKPSAMRFLHKGTGRPLYLVYNRLFNRLPTMGQQPDNVIQFASENRMYIFDAKYKIQFNRDYLKQYGGLGPTTEDINTMHRYRDAIAIPHPMRPTEYIKGVVQGAVVLFPYTEEQAYRSHRFYASIGQVEIGGLPFLPNATALVAEKIASLLAAEYPEGDAELSQGDATPALSGGADLAPPKP